MKKPQFHHVALGLAFCALGSAILFSFSDPAPVAPGGDSARAPLMAKARAMAPAVEPQPSADPSPMSEAPAALTVPELGVPEAPELMEPVEGQPAPMDDMLGFEAPIMGELQELPPELMEPPPGEEPVMPLPEDMPVDAPPAAMPDVPMAE
jgi:hypothetical protein